MKGSLEKGAPGERTAIKLKAYEEILHTDKVAEILSFLKVADDANKNVMAYTQTFNDPIENKKPSTQLKMQMGLFKNLSKCARFLLFTEMTLRGRIHLHGLIYFTDSIKWYKSTSRYIRLQYGNWLLKPISDRKGWLDYISKDQIEMNGIIPNMSFPITNDNYTQIDAKPIIDCKSIIKKGKTGCRIVTRIIEEVEEDIDDAK